MNQLIKFLTLTAATITVATAQPFSTTVAFAEVPPPQRLAQNSADSRVQQALERENLNYTISDNGNYRVGIRFQNGRNQAVWISSATDTVENLEMREVTSAVYLTQGDLPADLANRLLRDNMRKIWGAWQVVTDSQGRTLVMFRIQVRADASPEELGTAVRVAASSADLMEADITNEDSF